MQGDLRSKEDVARAVAGVDCVWHARSTQKTHEDLDL